MNSIKFFKYTNKTLINIYAKVRLDPYSFNSYLPAAKYDRFAA